eukprot:1193863-Prorocentrum_minimum.AAC.3
MSIVSSTSSLQHRSAPPSRTLRALHVRVFRVCHRRTSHLSKQPYRNSGVASRTQALNQPENLRCHLFCEANHRPNGVSITTKWDEHSRDAWDTSEPC